MLGIGHEYRVTRNMLMDDIYAPSEIRDRFLKAIDAEETMLCLRLAHELTSCSNPLPGMVCEQLSLPRGSTYGAAARYLLVHGSATR